MRLHSTDLFIILGYFLTAIVIGFWVSRRKAKDLDSYFLGGKALPWYMLGVSNASGMFDITGTMWMVYILFAYGLKSVWLPWMWPTFNQIFLMVFLSAWLRRSNVLTGAEWIATRFGRGTGANLAHISVVVFALVSVVGMLAYAFKGIGKFAVVMLPWHFTNSTGYFSDENIYAIIILLLVSIYAIKGGMFSVVITEVLQFAILTIVAVVIGVYAMIHVSPELVAKTVPAGWDQIFFGWKLGIDWTGIFDQVQTKLQKDDNGLFAIIFGLMFFKGVLSSMAGPSPNYDMQRVLATRSPREASLMSGMVNVVLFFPRYMMITGLTILAMAFCMSDLRAMPEPDFEKLLPIVLPHLPVGVVGFLLAGLLAAFMSNFAATINAAPAYIVNDIYKRFINPNSPPSTQVNLSRVASVVVLVVGIGFGLVTTDITEILMWVTGALGAGYLFSNVLKWYWWRFNSYGYFWGMVAGIVGAMVVPPAMNKVIGHSINALYTFPVILALSVVGCLLGALLTKPEDTEVLKKFYKNVRPWGFWGPIRDVVMKEDPKFVPNRDFKRDCANVAVGIVWQLCLTALPIYLVLRMWSWFFGTLVLLAVTSLFLKFFWYDTLEKEEVVSSQAQQKSAPVVS